MGTKLHDGRAIVGTSGGMKGRGAGLNPEGRFESTRREACEDGGAPGVAEEDDALPALRTSVTREEAKSILTRNDSPDIPFSWSINPYRGCEHGCIYCYARPSHAYLDLSPGLDFETRLFAKVNAAALLQEALARPGHEVDTIALGANTDPYQPVEREYRITRSLIEVLADCRHPFAIVTKNALVLRDLDLLAPLGAARLCRVFISITTLDAGLARRLELRASAPARRLEAVRALKDAGVPVGVMVAPVIPFLTDDGVERILEASAEAGAEAAAYVLLRLPYEIKGLFQDWLERHSPLKAEHVMQRMRAMRGGRENDPRFGSRMVGDGTLATLLQQRFEKALRRFGMGSERMPLDGSQFRPPRLGGQQRLF
jgi:DNA repair photolyase